MDIDVQSFTDEPELPENVRFIKKKSAPLLIVHLGCIG